MKKSLILALCAIATLQVSAQRWSETVHPADEMQNTKEYISYMYSDEKDNNFIYWSGSNGIRIINNEGLFDSDLHRSFKIQIGYYDKTGKLIKKENKTLYLLKDDYQKAETSLFSTGKKVIDYIKNKDGYVRILAPQYQKITPWEILVPCKKN